MRYLLCLVGVLFLAISAPVDSRAASEFKPGRTSLDNGWKFHLGDTPEAKDPAFDDTVWRTLDLPHDWSIEGSIDRKNAMGGPGGFFAAGIGWYRHHFDAPEIWRGQHVSVEFEGIYTDAEVFLNGQSVARQTYGYTTFHVDLDPKLLRYGQENVLAVRVDNSHQINSRWYSGSGIYRHVWLHTSGWAHLRPDDPWVHVIEIKDEGVNLNVNCAVSHEQDHANPAAVSLEIVILAPDGSVVKSWPLLNSLNIMGISGLGRSDVVPGLAPWTPEDPRLYTVRVRLREGETLLDERETAFGARTVAWSADEGFQLNGRTIKLCGGCVHHDNGMLGAAAFDQAEERRVRLLKGAGFNAVRTAHNPPSPAFLNACDRLGLLVLDEAFDCWEKGKNTSDYHTVFKDQWQHDLDAMVRRDRNHPSVVIWSIGNEVEERAVPDGVRIGKMLADHVRFLDPDRPVTSAICPVGKHPWTDTDGLFGVLDIGGYNYTLENAAGNPRPGKLDPPEIQTHATDHLRVPKRVMMSTESYPQDTFAYYDLVSRFPYIVGDFVWTAMDYLGESGIGQVAVEGKPSPEHGAAGMFPSHGGSCGDLDLIGVRRPISHYRNILWDRGEKIFMAVQEPARSDGKKINMTRWSVPQVRDSWTWPGQEGKELNVEVYTKADRVRLSLDGKELGQVPVTRAEQYRATFKVPYAAGALKAEALQDGKPVAEYILVTAGEPAALRLVGDQIDALPADGRSVSFISVEAVDEQGRLCPDAAQELQIDLTGPGSLAGLGNGDLANAEPYFDRVHHLFQGRAMVAIRSTKEGGEIHLKATAKDLPPSETVIRTRVPSVK